MRPALHLFSVFALCSALPAADERVRLEIVPTDIVLARPGESQRFLVLARDTEGHTEDVTAEATPTSAAPDIVAIEAPSKAFVGRNKGTAVIRVRVGRLSATATVTVEDGPSSIAVQFTPDVVSVLTIKGCNSSGCHGSPAGQNGFKLSLFG